MYSDMKPSASTLCEYGEARVAAPFTRGARMNTSVSPPSNVTLNGNDVATLSGEPGLRGGVVSIGSQAPLSPPPAAHRLLF